MSDRNAAVAMRDDEPTIVPDRASAPPRRVLAVLATLMGFASISTDLYLPAMPAMGRALGADAGAMELTVSGFLIGFSLGQLLWGPIGDRFGRRGPVAVGLVLFVLGSIGCATAGSASSIVAWRVLQAIGASAGVVLGRAMVRDLYEGPRAAQMMSTLIVVMAIAPLLGPIVGAEILVHAGWRAIFWALVAIASATLLALGSIPETLPEARRNREPLLGAFFAYGPLLRRRRMLGYAGAGAFFYAGVYAYIAGTPFAFMVHHHVPETVYGVLFAAGILGIMAANTANARLVRRFGVDRLLVGGTAVAAVAGVIVAVDAFGDVGGLWGLVLPLFAFVSTSGFIVANSITGALADFPHRAGAVSALVGAIHYGAGIFGSALVGLLADGSPWPMGAIIAVCGLGSVACALVR